MLLSKVRRTIERWRMIEPGNRVLAGVSGGPDSIALLHTLFSLRDRFKFDLAVAHFNHKLRGVESDEDEAFVREAAGSLGLQIFVLSGDVRELAKNEGFSLEEAGRILRLDFFARLCAELNFDRVALGHTANDQAETVLMRLLRGAGPRGLAAIYPVRDLPPGCKIIRPLIDATRQEVLVYLKKHNLSFRLDRTNLDASHPRNRIRLELIPLLKERFNPRIIAALCRLARLVCEDEALLSEIASEKSKSVLVERDDAVCLQVAALVGEHAAIARRILLEAVKLVKGDTRKITMAHVEQMLALCKPEASGRSIVLPGRVLVEREFESLRLRPAPQDRTKPFAYDLKLPGQVTIPEAGWRIEAEVLKLSAPISQDDSREALLEAGRLPDSLTVRSRKPGDRYRPGNRRARKLKKLLIESRVSKSLRDRLPLLEAGGQIVWVPGFPPPAEFAAKADSERVVLLKAVDLKGQ